MTTAIILGSIAAALLAAKKKNSVQGVGGVLWDYAIIECQNAGIDLSKDFFQLSSFDLSNLEGIRKKFGYRQSKSSAATGRSQLRSFYYALQKRANIY